MTTYIRRFYITVLSIAVILGSCTPTQNDSVHEVSMSGNGLMFAILRNLDKEVGVADNKHAFAIMKFNPFSEDFGTIIQQVNGPLGHHGYVSPINGGLYLTMADQLVSKAAISIGPNGMPQIKEISKALEGNGYRVGEDITWLQIKGKDYYAVTSLDGNGKDLLGAINIYDANNDQLVRSITNEEKLRYTHGISVFDDKPIGLVTSVIHEDISLYGTPSVDSLGHEVSLVNFETGEVIKNYDLGTTKEGFPVAPVECAIFRESFHPQFKGNERALVVEMVSGNLVSANWNEEKGEFEPFEVVYSPKDEKEYFPLEIFADEEKIYITYAERVKTFYLENYAKTGELIETGLDFETKSCAHHLAFFDAYNPETSESIPVLLVQQNLLNLGQQPHNTKFALPIELASHEVTAYNRLTGEVLNTVNIVEKHNLGIEYIGGIKQNAYLHHH